MKFESFLWNIAWESTPESNLLHSIMVNSKDKFWKSAVLQNKVLKTVGVSM